MHEVHQSQRVICNDTLTRLQNGIQNPAVYRNFISQYVQMLPRRYQRLSAAMHAGDEHNAMDAVLSIRSSSTMIGAVWLARLAIQIEGALRAGEPERAKAALQEMESCGRRTAERLTSEITATQHRGTELAGSEHG